MSNKKTEVEFSAILKFFRNRAGLSQLDLSLISNVATSTIEKLEMNERKASDKVKHKLAEALKLNSKEQALLCGVNLYRDDFEIDKLKIMIKSEELNFEEE